MRSTTALFCLFAPVALLLAGCPSSGQNAQTDSESFQAKAPKLNADSAWAHIKTQVDFGPRVPGMPGHEKQLAWMLEYLRSRADSVIEQPLSYKTTKGKQLQLTNVIARFNPDAQDRVLLVTHWDTRPTANEDPDERRQSEPISGANDGASGTALLLEIANVLKANKPPIGVDLLFVDGEDFGPTGEDMYIGAKYFAANPRTPKPLYAILVDMIGDQNPEYLVEANSQSSAPEVVDRVWRMAEKLGYANHFKRASIGGIEDDHVPLNKAGFRTIDIIDFDYAYWHTTGDVLEHTSPLGLGIVGAVLLELIFQGG